ncbi:MAG: cell division protein FtsZ [bacterium]|nr:cell division protein FtsZ [bacterium]
MKSKKFNNNNRSQRAQPLLANVKVVGVGGGGGNAVSRMSRNFIRGVDFIAINTDHQDLDQCKVREKIYIGRTLTRGLGTGMNPDLGRQAAEENRSEIAEALKGADLVFIAAGLGGGTGGGAAPVVAEAAKQAGALTIAVVTKPFAFEGAQRDRLAREALVKLKDKVDAIVVVPNDRIFTVISKDTPIMKAFEAIDDVLRNALNGIVELIVAPGIINVDFADVRAILQDAGVAIIGVGLASGAERAMNAVNTAINSPLLEASAEGAKAVLLGISGGRDLRMNEINDAAKLVAQMADPGARIIFGAYHDRNLKPNQIKITLIATGFNGSQPNSLFSAGSTEKRQTNFGNLTNDNMYGDDKSRPAHDLVKKPSIYHAKKTEEHGKVLTDKFDGGGKTAASKFGAGEHNKEERFEEKTGSPKRETDPWEIPAFLRRRRK